MIQVSYVSDGTLVTTPSAAEIGKEVEISEYSNINTLISTRRGILLGAKQYGGPANMDGGGRHFGKDVGKFDAGEIIQHTLPGGSDNVVVMCIGGV